MQHRDTLGMYSASEFQEIVNNTCLLTSLLVLGSVGVRALEHFPPQDSNINNLTYVLSASGAPGIYDSSITPDLEYGTYNWCNMPHVRAREYKWVCNVVVTPLGLTSWIEHRRNDIPSSS